MDIRPADFSDVRVVDLLAAHADHCQSDCTPAKGRHFLNIDALNNPDITTWVYWDEDDALGVIALKPFDEASGEVKSMHVARHTRGRGIGGQLISHLVKQAQQLGLRDLFLETAPTEIFQDAVKMYARHGFKNCNAFGDYPTETNSIFMHLNIQLV